MWIDRVALVVFRPVFRCVLGKGSVTPGRWSSTQRPKVHTARRLAGVSMHWSEYDQCHPIQPHL